MNFKRSNLLSLCFFLFFAPSAFSQDLIFSPSSLIFTNPTLSTQSDSLNIIITNNSCQYIKVDYIYCPNAEFKVDTNAFWLPASGTKTLKVKFSPRQNIEYKSSLILHTSTGDFSLPLTGYGKFIETYYDNTYNKFDESLKSSLNSILAANYQSFSYSAARDKMFMEFDNKKINGQGATQNTLECIYTGRLAVGYTSRADCQTNDNFNTEHTWPQSLFSSSLPMVSDLNHLFPTDDAANNYRGNNPFGMVPNPSWSVGGSKGTSTLFEPRDVQKGRTARAMLYFAIRYNSPSYGLVSFFGPQEAILRTWCLQFLPDSIDRKRNNDIFGYQKNRNPFIDHPEFLARITSIANNSVAPVKLLLWVDTVAVSKKYFVYDTLNYKVVLFNTGNSTIVLNKIQVTGNGVSVSYASSTIARQTALEITIKKILTSPGAITDTLLIESNSSNYTIIKIPLFFTVDPLKIIASKKIIAFSNDSSVLTLNSNGSVLWNTGNWGKTLVVKNAGIYYATVTDSNGCHSTDTVSITKSGLGLSVRGISSFSVFPNPASSVVYVKNINSSETNFTLINSLGEIIAIKSAQPFELIAIDIRAFANGVYFLRDDLGTGIKVLIKR